MLDQPQDTFRSDIQVCYEVLLYLSSRLAKLQPGELFAFVTSDPDAADEIEPWCEMHSYTLLSVETLPNSRQRFLIRK